MRKISSALRVMAVAAGAAMSIAVASAQGAGPMGGPPAGERPDFSEAAAKLGVTEEAIMTAMREARQASGEQGRPDLGVVAEKLGIEEDALREALPGRPMGQRPAQPDSR